MTNGNAITSLKKVTKLLNRNILIINWSISFVLLSSLQVRSITNFFAIYLITNFTDALFNEKEKYKAICDDLDGTFAELTGY